MSFATCYISLCILDYSTYDHRVWRTGLPVRSAVLKPHAGRLVVGWVTTSESLLLYVFIIFYLYFFLFLGFSALAALPSALNSAPQVQTSQRYEKAKKKKKKKKLLQLRPAAMNAPKQGRYRNKSCDISNKLKAHFKRFPERDLAAAKANHGLEKTTRNLALLLHNILKAHIFASDFELVNLSMTSLDMDLLEASKHLNRGSIWGGVLREGYVELRNCCTREIPHLGYLELHGSENFVEGPDIRRVR